VLVLGLELYLLVMEQLCFLLWPYIHSPLLITCWEQTTIYLPFSHMVLPFMPIQSQLMASHNYFFLILIISLDECLFVWKYFRKLRAKYFNYRNFYYYLEVKKYFNTGTMIFWLSQFDLILSIYSFKEKKNNGTLIMLHIKSHQWIQDGSQIVRVKI